MIVGGFLLLLMLVPAIIYFAWQAHGRRLLREQLTDIKASGDPLTTSEMAAWHVVPKGQRNVTDLWVAALKPFDGPAFTAVAGSTPIVGTGNAKMPALDQPLSAVDEESMRQFLAQAEPWVAGIRAAAAEPGEVRYPYDFRDGVALLLPHAQSMRSAVRSMKIEFEILVREQKLDAAIDNLQTRIATGETLRHDPILICMLVRIAIQGINLEDVRRLGATGQLNDAQLVRLQQLIRPIDIHAQLPDALIGERAMSFHAFHGPLSAGGDFGNVKPRETTHEVGEVGRPEDCAMAMQLLTEMLEASKQSPPEALAGAERIEKDIKALGAGESPVGRLRYVLTLTLTPAVGAVVNADARGEVMRDMTDAALAVQRYSLKHGAAPKTWDDLVPEFLPRIPQDAYLAQPLQLLVKDDRVLLYSVGDNLTDDGGATDENGLKPDIVIEVELPEDAKDPR
jgi:hypothetical protein